MNEQRFIPIGEHRFYLPPLPPKKEILFHEKNKRDQYWVRQIDFPDFFYEWRRETEMDAEVTRRDGRRLVSLNVEDSNAFREIREREMKRRKEGVWFYNNGEPVYLTGNHYFSLQWGAMKDVQNYIEPESNYGNYFRFQRDYFYFHEIISDLSMPWHGGMVVKPKKTGITQLESLAILNQLTRRRQKLARIMSTKQKVANESCFAYLDFALQNMPAALVPSIQNWNKHEVYFGMSEKKGSKSSEKSRETGDEVLDSHITTVPTSNSSFDSLTNFIAWCDEYTKIIEQANPKDLHEITKDTVLLGKSRRGTIIYTNYTQEFNDDSFIEGRQIWKESALATIDKETGMTKSKLIRYAMLESHGVFGNIKDGKMHGIDQYGNPIIEEILKDYNRELQSLKDSSSKIQAFKRRHPMTEEDPWMEAGGEHTPFDNVRLGNKLQQLENDSAMGKLAYEEFDLIFENEPKINNHTKHLEINGKVLYKPITDNDKMGGKSGSFKFRWYRKELTPQKWIDEHTNNLSIDRKNKLLKPRIENNTFAGMDPTNYNLANKVEEGSKNALKILLLPDGRLNGYMGRDVSNKRLMIQYLYRTQKPQETLMDVIKLVLYFGCPIFIEGNMPWVATRLIELGFGNFVMVFNEDGGMEPYKEGKKQKWFTTQGGANAGTSGKLVTAGQTHLAEPDSNQIDNIDYLDSEEVIKQLMRFNPENTKEFDAAMGYLIAEFGADNYMGYRQKELEKSSNKYNVAMKTIFEGHVR